MSAGTRRKCAVRGVNRRVVIVRSPGADIFEQAIFIVREDYLERGGVSPRELLRQAEAAAESLVPSPARRSLPAAFLAGAAAGLALGALLGIIIM